jgi:hypothetical protein
LGDQDYVAVIAFDSTFHEIAPLQRASHRRAIMRDVAGINAQGGTVMHPPMARAYEMLKGAKASLKHCVVLTDGQSQPGDFEGLVRAMVADRIHPFHRGRGGRTLTKPCCKVWRPWAGAVFYPVQFVRRTAAGVHQRDRHHFEIRHPRRTFSTAVKSRHRTGARHRWRRAALVAGLCGHHAQACARKRRLDR